MSTAAFCLWCLALGMVVGVALIAIVVWMRKDGWFEAMFGSPEYEKTLARAERERHTYAPNLNPWSKQPCPPPISHPNRTRSH